MKIVEIKNTSGIMIRTKMITLLILIFACSNAQSLTSFASENLIITQSKNQTPLPTKLNELAEKYDVYFSYDIASISAFSVSKSWKEKKGVERNLRSLFAGKPLAYKKVSKNNFVIFMKVSETNREKPKTKILAEDEVIHREEKRENLGSISELQTSKLKSLYASSLSQEILEVTGTIKDANNDPMIGVTIVLKSDPSIGTVSDFDGNFIINIQSESDTLQVSYIGYKPQEIPLNGRTVIDVVLEPQYQTLDEVVVVGFGTQKKRHTTGAISSVRAEEIATSTASTVEGALQGRIAGVQVTTSDAMAGSPVTIRIRGTSSIVASSDPLYVVDGVPIVTGNYSHNNASSWSLATAHESNALAQLNPADIESIEILKDASAAAIYGSRGANGVVLITTKGGKKGGTKFNVDYRTGISKETNRIELLDGSTYLGLAKEAWDNSYVDDQKDDNPLNDNRYSPDNDHEKFWNAILPAGLTKEKALNTNTDWIDQALQQGSFNEGSISASGGNDKTLFYIGGTYRDEVGIFVGNNFKRYNARVNIDHNPTSYLSLGARTAYTVTDNDIIPISWAGGLGTAQSQALPFWPIHNEDGTYFNAQTGNNVVAELENTEMNQKGSSILGNIYAQVKFTENLSFRTDLGVNNIYKKEFYYRSAIIEPAAISTSVLSETRNWNINNTLNYSNTFGLHTLDVLGGMNATKNDYFSNIINGETFPNPALKNPQNAANQTASVATTQFSFLSYLGRVNYRFNERYLLSMSIRRDGSSRFGSGNRWGTFPAISLGWIISDEPFMNSYSLLSFLKLRATYGETGNAEIGNFEYFGSFQTNNYVDKPGIVIQEIENASLGWESTKQYDLGLDFGILEGRIEGGIDFYLKQTNNLLTEKDVSALSGVQRVTSNIGSLENRGVDLSLTSHNLVGKFTWTTNLNLAYNKNKITDLGGRSFVPGQTFGLGAVGVGYPVGARYTIQWAGIAANDMQLIVTNPETMTQEEIQVAGGEELFINQFGETTNIYDPNNDQVFIGNPTPVWIGGITNSFTFGNFDANVLFTFAAGHDLANDEQNFQFNGIGYGWNMWSAGQDRWQDPGDFTDIQRLTWGPERRGSSRFMYSADYVRLREVSIGYNLPSDLLRKMRVENLRIYAKGTNLMTFTDYPGWDPEYNRDGAGNVGQGKSWLPSPQAMGISFGLNMNF